MVSPFHQLFEAIQVGINEVPDLGHGVGHPSLTHLEHQALGLVHGLDHVVGSAVADLSDLVGRTDEAPQSGVFLDDPGVLGGAGGGGSRRLEFQQQARSAYLVQQSGPGQGLSHGDRISRLSRGVQATDRLEHVTVRGLVEVLGVDDLQRVGNGVARQQHGAEERGLGVEVVRRDPCTRRTVGRAGTPVSRPRSRIVVIVVRWFFGKRDIGGKRREVGKGHVRRTGWFARLVHAIVIERPAHVGPPVSHPPMSPRMHGLPCGVLEGKLRLLVPNTPLRPGISRPILWIASRPVRRSDLRTIHDTTGVRPRPVPRRSPARRPRHGVR